MRDTPAFLRDLPAGFLDDAVAFAGHLADLAGETIRPYFRQPLDVESKADASPVTAADRAAEAVMRKAIEAQYPEHGIFGEEYGHLRPEAPWQWILDPIDGTKSFVTGLPIFGTLVALTYDFQPVIGVIDRPITRDRWLGAPGRPTTCNGQPARTSKVETLAGAAVLTTYVDAFNEAEAAACTRLRKSCRINRMSGDRIAYAFVASCFASRALHGRMPHHHDVAVISPAAQEGTIYVKYTLVSTRA